MGFLWEEIRKESNIIKSRYLKQKEFHEMIVSLKEYKQKNGDCNVPHKYPENPRLGVFVRRMVRMRWLGCRYELLLGKSQPCHRLVASGFVFLVGVIEKETCKRGY